MAFATKCKKGAWISIRVFFLLPVLAAFSILFARHWWVAEMLANISGHLAIVLALSLVLWRKQSSVCLAIILALLLCAWNSRGLNSMQESTPIVFANTEQKALKMVMANTAFWNRETAATSTTLLNEDADIYALFEVSPDLFDQLSLVKKYPYKEGRSSYGPYGILIMSRYPILSQQWHWIEGPKRANEYSLKAWASKVDPSGQIPLIEAFIQHPEYGKLRVLALHTSPGVRPKLSTARKACFDKLQELIRADNTPTIIAGDLNLDPKSPFYQDFAALGLKRSAGKIPRTWHDPDGFGILDPLREIIGLRIDHIWTDQQLAIDNLQAFRVPGSDHSALRANIAPVN